MCTTLLKEAKAKVKVLVVLCGGCYMLCPHPVQCKTSHMHNHALQLGVTTSTTDHMKCKKL